MNGTVIISASTDKHYPIHMTSTGMCNCRHIRRYKGTYPMYCAVCGREILEESKSIFDTIYDNISEVTTNYE